MDSILQKRAAADPDETRLEPMAAAPHFPYKFLIGGTILLTIVLAYLVYGFFTLQEGQKALATQFQQQLQQQAKQTQAELEDLKKRLATQGISITDLKSDTGVIRQKVGVTQNDLNQARAQVAQIKQEQTEAVSQIQAVLGTKADATQLTEVQKDAEQKIGAVHKDVGAVRTDVEETKKTLGETQRQLVDVRDTLASQIARNKSELEELRRKGERDYVEFAAEKKIVTAVRDIKVELRGTDPKKSKYDLAILVDDQRLEKKARTANEPVQFLVGKDKVRYEIVINSVTKNKVEGYLSIPKDRGLSAERPALK